MKKMILTLAVLASAVTAVSAQDREIDLEQLDNLNKIEITGADARVEANLGLVFPMYFGTSILSGIDYKGDWASYGAMDFLQMRSAKNFVYGLQIASLNISYEALDVSLGLRWTFMDFAFKDPRFTLRPVNKVYLPTAIEQENPAYDFNKSKIHASYFGIPLRVGVNFGKAKVYVGGSVELLTNGYTKYKRPKNRQQAKGIFNPFRATVEGGFAWGGLGIFVMYGLTPLFPDTLSDTRTVTLGVTLGI